MSAPPVIHGPSLRGLHAEKVLRPCARCAGLASDQGESKGVRPRHRAQQRAGLPALGNPTNLHKSVMLTEKEFRFGFGNAVTEEESNQLYAAWAVPSPARPIFQAAVANFALHSQAAVATANHTPGPPPPNPRPGAPPLPALGQVGRVSALNNALTPSGRPAARKYRWALLTHFPVRGRCDPWELTPRIGPRRYCRRAVQAYLDRETPPTRLRRAG